MKPSGNPRSPPPAATQADEDWAHQAKPLRECGEIAATRLAAAFSDALRQAADHLFATGARHSPSPDQRMWLDAADFARQRRQDMVDAFRKHFLHRYALACRHGALRPAAAMPRYDMHPLAIVEHEVLDNGLDGEMLVEAIRNGTWHALHELTKWFREVQATPDLIPNEMPLSPKLVGGAITDAIQDQFWGLEAKHRLLRALCRALPEPINRLYQDLTVHMAWAGASVSDEEDMEAGMSVPTEVRAGTDAAEPAAAAPMREPPDAKHAAAAQAAVAGRLSDPRLPGLVHEFLSGPWSDLMARLHRDEGPGGRAWSAALDTMDDLCRSLLPAEDGETRALRMRELPELVRRLRQGLAALESAPDAHDTFFARLADCHVRLLSTPHVPPSPPVTFDSADVPLDSLEVGTWLAFTDTDSAPRELKLAWISPHRKLFILTNQRGERALSLNAKDLAARLRDGHARVVRGPNAARAGTSTPSASLGKKSA